MIAEGPLSLTVKRIINATTERVFSAWTEQRHLTKWWGPKGVVCIGATIDFRVGGSYRIGNRMPNGSEVWISGTYEEIVPTEKLVFLWHLEHQPEQLEKVTVLFTELENGCATEVCVTHEKIADNGTYQSHQTGWEGCLFGLDEYLSNC